MAPPPDDSSPFLLKDLYTPALLASCGQYIQQAWPAFSVAAWQEQTLGAPQWAQYELKERVRCFSAGLRALLPGDYGQAVGILAEAARRLTEAEGEKLAFEYMFLPDFVECYGIEHPDASIAALETMTRWASAEFAVRPFLRRYPARMYAQMLMWSQHESAMVRRLSSEGFRPRLPWGMGVPALKKDPSPILPVLENLQCDPAETVRRSVANNLNDIAKDHPALVLDIAERWQGRHPLTDWVVRHACRGLLKRGDARALALFGFQAGLPGIALSELRCSPQVPIGGKLDFSFSLANRSRQAANIRLEYAICYLTSTGKVSRKVFQIKEFLLAPGAEVRFSRAQRFQDFTTRKHYPGPHRLEIVVNGRVLVEAGFEVVGKAPGGREG
jgi:3-methyladenine DNA glycosylase AlkC